MGATLKIFEIFPRLMREFHSVSLIIGIFLISNAFAHASCL
ncbi:hypothetical protein HPCPY6261_0549 [Helicobacter pylori CPY6261]|nr:hypothetical protein HPCPY6261_0549 [Helicobacter pylori CPY6261]